MNASHRPPRGVAAIRDANESAFAVILQQLNAALPGAYASAFIDEEGECIEYAGAVDPYHIKVAGARLRIVLAALDDTRALGTVHTLVVRAARESMTVQRVLDQYALVVLFSRGGGFTRASRAFAVAERQITEECGMKYTGERWYPAQLTFDARGKPQQWLCEVDGTTRAEPVEIVGSVMGLARGERGFRLRTSDGEELMAIREASRVWYTDSRASRLSTPPPARRSIAP